MASSPAGPMEPEIILDLSRLLSRILHPTPTGVDRCEMAYARGLLKMIPERLSFAAVHPLGCYGRLDTQEVVRFLDRMEQRWEHQGSESAFGMRMSACNALLKLRPRMARPPSRRGAVYLQASPSNLALPERLARILRREQARFACLVHDLIPLQYPEYARPDGAREHYKRVSTIARFADAIIANSHATLGAIAPHLTQKTSIRGVAHLGLYRDVPKQAPETVSPHYFICIGTIEPRKNHLLLLNIWRRMAETLGADRTPRLVIVGRRGWENEQIVDMLERCAILRDCVTEYGGLPDREVRFLLSGARALLLPSFAEGYGLPVAEALAQDIPVICSDLPALREVGGDVPEYLDPIDGQGWLRMIEEYDRSESPARAEQIDRMRGWRPMTWSRHLAIVLEMLQRLSGE